MKFPLFIAFLLVSQLTLFGCSHHSRQDHSSHEGASSTAEGTQPTHYGAYRAWRERYDPSGQAYADYKAWEGAYRRWQLQQQTLSSQQAAE